MRAAAIFGLNINPTILDLFQRPDLGTYVTREQAPSTGADATLIIGGDGTVHRHLHRLVEVQKPALVVPAGSGNDFACNLGLRTVSDTVRAWERFLETGTNVRRIDLGIITPIESGAPVESRATFFCNVAGAGLDSETNRRANTLPRWLRARGGYVLAALRSLATFQPFTATVAAEQCALHEPATFVSFGNAPAYGHGMRMLPRACFDDRKLDVCFVRKTSKIRLLRFFPTVFTGSHIGLPEVEYFQTPILRLETHPVLDVYADGEYVCRTPVQVSVAPAALPLVVPR